MVAAFLSLLNTVPTRGRKEGELGLVGRCRRNFYCKISFSLIAGSGFGRANSRICKNVASGGAFFHCPFSSQVWHSCHKWLGILTVVPENFNSHLIQFGGELRTSNARRGINLFGWQLLGLY